MLIKATFVQRVPGSAATSTVIRVLNITNDELDNPTNTANLTKAMVSQLIADGLLGLSLAVYLAFNSVPITVVATPLGAAITWTVTLNIDLGAGAGSYITWTNS
jgi:hypothetical protein